MALVCWSGGLDSTLTLYQLALERQNKCKNCESDKHGLRALSIIHAQVCNSDKATKAREASKKQFEELGLKFKHTVVTIGNNGDFGAEQCYGLVQPLLWLAVAVPYLYCDEDLYMGYISGDCIWRYTEYMKYAFNNLQSVNGKTGLLRFPLELITKAEVIIKLKEAKLYDKCWYCEGDNVKDKPCGKCVPCITHRTALWQIKEKLYSPKPTNHIDRRTTTVKSTKKGKGGLPTKR